MLEPWRIRVFSFIVIIAFRDGKIRLSASRVLYFMYVCMYIYSRPMLDMICCRGITLVANSLMANRQTPSLHRKDQSM